MSKARTPEWRMGLFCLLSLSSTVLTGCEGTSPSHPETPTAPALSPTSEPLPTKTPLPKRTIIDLLHRPIDQQAVKGRANQLSSSPEKYHRQIDDRLAKLGTTLLLYVCGIDHEPPAVEKVLICSNSLFIWTHDGTVFVVNFTHDVRMPEQEIEEGILGKENSARRSDTLWLNRKNDQRAFVVMREAYQNATGFPIDYIMVLKSDVAVKDLVNDVFDNKLTINIPIGFTAQPVYLDDKTKLPERTYQAGVQSVTAQEAYQYLKAVAKTTDNPRDLENNVRKEHVLTAIFNALAQKKNDPLTWPGLLLKLKSFMDKQSTAQNVAADFDLSTIITNNLGAVAQEAGMMILKGEIPEIGALPSLGGSLYLVDQSVGPTKPEAVYGPGFPWPLIWGNLDSGDPHVIRDVKDLKIYQPGYVEVPRGGDALKSTDLPNQYWPATRGTMEWYFLDKKPWQK